MGSDFLPNLRSFGRFGDLATDVIRVNMPATCPVFRGVPAQLCRTEKPIPLDRARSLGVFPIQSVRKFDSCDPILYVPSMDLFSVRDLSQ